MISMKSEAQFTQAEIRLLRAVIARAERKGLIELVSSPASTSISGPRKPLRLKSLSALPREINNNN